MPQKPTKNLKEIKHPINKADMVEVTCEYCKVTEEVSAYQALSAYLIDKDYICLKCRKQNQLTT